MKNEELESELKSSRTNLKRSISENKNQSLFSKLISRIEKLELNIASESSRIQRLFQFYQDNISNQQVQLALLKMDFAYEFDDLTNKAQLSERATEKVKDSILILFDEAFEVVEPNTEQEELFNKWSDISYQEEVRSKKEFNKNRFATFVKNVFGSTINSDGVDLNDPESIAQFEAKMKVLYEGNSKNKSKNGIEKENQLLAAELIQNKSLRSIYISLTKALHPDTETDEVLKKEKEEIMKSVTIAYEQKDLSTLLKLEMEWVFKTKENLDKLSDDKLKLYISILKERVSELEKERFMLYRNPTQIEVRDYIDYPEIKGFQLIKEEAKLMERTIIDFKSDVLIFQQTRNKTRINELIDEFYSVYCDDKYGFDEEIYY